MVWLFYPIFNEKICLPILQLFECTSVFDPVTALNSENGHVHNYY
jgi:hypothetical protein